MGSSSRFIGVVGGFGPADADFVSKLRAAAAVAGLGELEIDVTAIPPAEETEAGQIARKLRVYDAVREFARRGADRVFLPDGGDQSFRAELAPESGVPVIDLPTALRAFIEESHPQVRTVGILGSGVVRTSRLFEPALSALRCVYPRELAGLRSPETLRRACQDLVEQGAELIVPVAAALAPVVETLRQAGFPLVDTAEVYAAHGVALEPVRAKPFKIGVVGGVGPAATVDFLDKIVRATPASRDQEHIKVVVEQNPQIPDRTGALLRGGIDPTIALYATCKRLEADDASIIAIPCNTAHAFVDRIQPHLSIPIVSMLQATVDLIRTRYGTDRPVGLLASSGTVRSGVYHAAARGSLPLMVPDDAHQEKVMAAIYGAEGVKAGFTDGQCKQDLLEAVEHLVKRGAEILILGCTELPILIDESDDYRIAGKSVVMLDPTNILARKCVALAQEAAAPAVPAEVAVAALS